jgi:AICAR transformylase/IMP cyclohydrolase PurH
VVFGEVGEELASVLARVVSDGIAATGFTDKALDQLSRKCDGRYLVVKLDPDYVPPQQESRELFGVRVVQDRNDYLPIPADFKVVVGTSELGEKATDDLCLAIIAMKYTISNNIEEASKYGVQVILEPERALRSDEVEKAAALHGMTLVQTKHRYFYH